MRGAREPDTREIAMALDVDGRRLRQLTRAHPDPTPAALRSWAGADAEAVDTEQLLAWLERVDREQRQGQPQGGQL